MRIFSLFFVPLFLLIACRATNKPDQSASNVDCVVHTKGNVSFGQYFIEKTMRLDLYHTGNSTAEMFAVDNVLSDGAWAGSKTVLLDELNLGLYFYDVIDKESKVLLYSRGFASVFGEWQTTPEASERWGTFSESIRFPWPLKPVTVIIKKRDSQNNFRQIWSTDVDPSNRQVVKAERVHAEKVDVIADNGPAQEKLDIVILGDGYTAVEMEKFRGDAKRLSTALLTTEPFKSQQKSINIRAVETPAMQSGVSKPHHGVYRRSPLSVSYSAFDSERYALTFDNKTVRDVASAVPYDCMVILINERTYGGGGIYNLYTTVAADNKFSEYIMVHEFGHHLAALADEYYSSAVSYEAPKITVEPWEPNVTALLDKNNLKWKDLVDDDAPIPTPWNKEAFDAYSYGVQKVRDSIRANHLPETVMEDLFIKEKAKEDEFFSKEQYKDKVGAFEGADYCEKGMYRPQLDCIMYTRHNVFCKVCQHSILRVIQQYSN